MPLSHIFNKYQTFRLKSRHLTLAMIHDWVTSLHHFAHRFRIKSGMINIIHLASSVAVTL